MKLRDYQEQAVQSIFDYFVTDSGNPLVALPTGSGKSLVIAEFCRRALHYYPNTRIMMATHVKELISQNAEKLQTLWPHAPLGIYSAGLRQRDTRLPITFVGVRSAVGKYPIFGRIDILVIDEAHLVSPDVGTSYQELIAELKKDSPNLKVVGLSATCWRSAQGSLAAGGIFTDICFDMTNIEGWQYFLDEGYLMPPIPRPTETQIDLSGVKIINGDYNQTQLEEAVDRDDITYGACRELVQWGHDRYAWMVFCAGVEHAEHTATMLNDKFGISCLAVHSKLNAGEADKRLKTYKAGEVRAIASMNKVTTGFDDPKTDLIGMLRPTQSSGLWVQMLGRGTRPLYAKGYDVETKEGRHNAIEAGGKHNCLVLDFAGNTKRCGPINDPVIPKRKGSGGGGDAPVRICSVCGTYNHARAVTCIYCDSDFASQPDLTATASTDELLALPEPEYKIFDVLRTVYNRQAVAGKPPSIKVTYFAAFNMFSELVCLEHEGYASKVGRDWWRQRTGQEPPLTVDEALQHTVDLKAPRQIKVQINMKYPKVVEHLF